MQKNCDFCKDEVILKQEIIKTENIRIIYPRKPVIAESVLIMPIRCVRSANDLTSEEVAEIFKFVKLIDLSFSSLYDTSGYNLFLYNGESAGQHVPHVHFHFFGRKKDEKANPLEVLGDREKYRSRKEMEVNEWEENKNIITCKINDLLIK